MRSDNLQTRLLKRIDRKRGDVFLRSDFRHLGGYEPGRAGSSYIGSERHPSANRAGSLYAGRCLPFRRHAGAGQRTSRPGGGSSRPSRVSRAALHALNRPTMRDKQPRCRQVE